MNVVNFFSVVLTNQLSACAFQFFSQNITVFQFFNF